MDKESGAIFVDRILSTPMRYPCNYGYVPNTVCGDGDPADVLGVIQLPLKPDSLHTEFVINYNGRSDTLKILHDNDMQFISLACGCLVFHTIEGWSISRNFLDSVHILNDLVTTSGDRHMQLYFHKW